MKWNVQLVELFCTHTNGVGGAQYSMAVLCLMDLMFSTFLTGSLTVLYIQIYSVVGLPNQLKILQVRFYSIQGGTEGCNPGV